MINFFIKTYGCQANVADSQAIANFLIEQNCTQVTKESEADLIIINTCAIRDKAEQRVFSYLGKLAQYKKYKKYLSIGVIGCIASYKKAEIFSRFASVNFVFGAKDNLSQLEELLIDVINKIQTAKQLFENELVLQETSLNKLSYGKLALGGLKKDERELKQSFVNIMTGCNNYCSYCIVPFTRGREKSYPLNEIIQRIVKDVQDGAKEVTLLGQNVNSYKDPQTGASFSQLLEKVAQIEDEFWVKFVSPHPKDMTIDVLDIMAKYKEKLCGFIHHPLQSGSNKILQAMNRTYTKEQYLEQIGWIKEKLPHATLSTDIIVGFPGETEQDYLQTREVLEAVKFDNTFSFIYSPRKYTKAALLDDDCPHQTKLERLDSLQARQIDICAEKNSAYLDKILKCLVEKRLTNGKLLARSEGNHRILFDGSGETIGNFIYLKIVKTGAANLVGSLIEQK